MRHDIDRPTAGGYQAVDAWKMARKGIDVCEHSVHDQDTTRIVTTSRGDSWCTAEYDGTCNDPVYLIESSQEGADGTRTSTCTDGSGAARDCPSVTCQ